mgnify:FL=1
MDGSSLEAFYIQLSLWWTRLWTAFFRRRWESGGTVWSCYFCGAKCVIFRPRCVMLHFRFPEPARNKNFVPASRRVSVPAPAQMGHSPVNKAPISDTSEPRIKLSKEQTTANSKKQQFTFAALFVTIDIRQSHFYASRSNAIFTQYAHSRHVSSSRVSDIRIRFFPSPIKIPRDLRQSISCIFPSDHGGSLHELFSENYRN